MSELAHIVDSIDHFYIDEKSLGTELALRIQDVIPKEKYSIVSTEPYANAKGDLSAQQFDRSKREVFVTPHLGKFFKRCPGARPGLTCCNYFVLNLGLQCNMNCSYCYLQSFINTPVMKIYSNIDAALLELNQMGHGDVLNMPLRIGTGEVIDSLSLDPLTLYSRKLIAFFRDKPQWRLEFKTKSDYVDQFLDVEHGKNVIVSFSINPQYIIEHEEHGTASLDRRLLAAKKSLDRNFQISFHIDPVIWHEDWRSNYAAMVDQITKIFNPKDLPYMSLGALRFQPEQRHIMRERFGANSLVNRAEMFASSDGKWRYDQSRREEMFEFILNRFHSHSKEWKIFLCMETPETWLGSAGKMPKQVSGLTELFDHRVLKKINEIQLGK